MSKNSKLEKMIQLKYQSIPENVREDIYKAIKWAKATLTKKEGSGHEFFVTAAGRNQVCCSFAKPEWQGDHCGRGMEHGASAIVIAVCEYLCEIEAHDE